jgi:hypothetical protein
MRKSIISVILFSALLSRLGAQGNGSIGVTDARSLSMAKSFTASSFWIYAVGQNPANLYRDTLERVDLILPIPLPNISATVGSNFLSIDQYNYYFGTKVTNPDGTTSGRILTAADKNNLKNLFADGGTVISDVNLQLFSISIQPSEKFGALAFTISDRISGILTFPKDLINLGIDGNLPDKVYNFNDAQFKAWWLRKYAITYSRAFSRFVNFGFSLNVVHGFAYAGIDEIKSELKTEANNVISGQGNFLAHSVFSSAFNVKYDFDNTKKEKDPAFTPFPTPAGLGIGLDLGVNINVSSVTSFGISITDIGKIKWSNNVAVFSRNAPVYLDDLTDQAQVDTLVNRLTGKESGRYEKYIFTQMATALHIGFAFRLDSAFETFPGRMLVAIDYHQGFNDQPGNSKKPRFVLGIDWGLSKAFSVRTGWSVGGFDNFNWGFGFGLDLGLMDFNFGTSDFHYLLSPNKAKRITVAVDSKWKF